jgi:putative FmdB family regulatory protein
MPIYEYRCCKCHRRVSVFLRKFSDLETARPICTHCGHDQLERLVSRVRTLKSEEARLDALSDSASLGDLNEEDPRSLARYMKKMAGEVGEDVGDEFHELVDRLEAGQSPEDIEKAVPDLGPGPAEDF